MSEQRISFATFPAGIEIDFDGRTLFLGAASFQPRSEVAGDGKSSPEWVKTIASATAKDLAIRVGQKRITELSENPGNSGSCTLASRRCQLRIIKAEDSPKESDEVFEVDILANVILLGLQQTDLDKTAVVYSLKASKTFDPEPTEPALTKDAKAWRIASDLAESMFANFAKP